MKAAKSFIPRMRALMTMPTEDSMMATPQIQMSSLLMVVPSLALPQTPIKTTEFRMIPRRPMRPRREAYKVLKGLAVTSAPSKVRLVKAQVDNILS